VARRAARGRPAARGGREEYLTPLRERTVAVWQGQVHLRVLSKGVGPAVLFFHGPWGLTWDPFLDELAQNFTVHAPEHPGTTPGAPDEIYHLDGLWDLVVCYEELLEALGVTGAAFVGHSFGAMVACEVAAARPDRARRVALIDPLGFWRDADPITNWMLLNPGQLPGHIFRDPDGEAARRMFPPGDDEEAMLAARVRLSWAMGATGKFIWPIPDKGLKRRLRRIAAPTLVLFGAEDAFVPARYAADFGKGIAGAETQVIAGAGHMLPYEKTAQLADGIARFLARN
jgi:pimeloyl-ACP methyl ester carboxylesterase